MENEDLVRPSGLKGIPFATQYEVLHDLLAFAQEFDVAGFDSFSIWDNYVIQYRAIA